jgi:cyclic pyranopterin phosphate synthase
MPDEGIEFIPHSEILTYEEMLYIVRLSILTGIRKVRLTGGEPLLRKGFMRFLERLSRIEGLEEITLTTNGVLLKRYAADIRNCGICRINVSLDSLNPDKFFRITGRDCFKQVWEGLEEAVRVGFNPIKINVVALKGVNDDEYLEFARLTLKKPYNVRFIELMPVGGKNNPVEDQFISSEEILSQIQALGDLHPIRHSPLDGPAIRYAIQGARGEIGFISALSHHFCGHCNRLRLTADGHLRGCLFSDQETDIKNPLREGKGDTYLLDLIKNTIRDKPENHGLTKSGPRKCIREMNSIGG